MSEDNHNGNASPTASVEEPSLTGSPLPPPWDDSEESPATQEATQACLEEALLSPAERAFGMHHPPRSPYLSRQERETRFQTIRERTYPLEAQNVSAGVDGEVDKEVLDILYGIRGNLNAISSYMGVDTEATINYFNTLPGEVQSGVEHVRAYINRLGEAPGYPANLTLFIPYGPPRVHELLLQCKEGEELDMSRGLRWFTDKLETWARRYHGYLEAAQRREAAAIQEQDDRKGEKARLEVSMYRAVFMYVYPTLMAMDAYTNVWTHHEKMIELIGTKLYRLVRARLNLELRIKEARTCYYNRGHLLKLTTGQRMSAERLMLLMVTNLVPAGALLPAMDRLRGLARSLEEELRQEAQQLDLARGRRGSLPIDFPEDWHEICRAEAERMLRSRRNMAGLNIMEAAPDHKFRFDSASLVNHPALVAHCEMMNLYNSSDRAMAVLRPVMNLMFRSVDPDPGVPHMSIQGAYDVSLAVLTNLGVLIDGNNADMGWLENADRELRMIESFSTEYTEDLQALRAERPGDQEAAKTLRTIFRQKVERMANGMVHKMEPDGAFQEQVGKGRDCRSCKAPPSDKTDVWSLITCEGCRRYRVFTNLRVRIGDEALPVPDVIPGSLGQDLEEEAEGSDPDLEELPDPGGDGPGDPEVLPPDRAPGAPEMVSTPRTPGPQPEPAHADPRVSSPRGSGMSTRASPAARVRAALRGSAMSTSASPAARVRATLASKMKDPEQPPTPVRDAVEAQDTGGRLVTGATPGEHWPAVPSPSGRPEEESLAEHKKARMMTIHLINQEHANIMRYKFGIDLVYHH